MINLDYFKGDLLESGAFGIAHQVNCLGKMGSGIAGQIRKKWPFVYEEYMYKFREDGWKLGDCQCVYLPDSYGKTKIVYNLASQEKFGSDGQRYTSYDALYNCLEDTFEDFQWLVNDWHSPNDRQILAIPRLGCGLGGGSWPIVEAIIETLIAAHPDYEFDLHVYDLP